jgi:hypothetical protein
MQTSRIAKDKRQFSHVKASSLEQGKPEETAEKIAARTVNKHRRSEGHTPNKTSMGTGNPHSKLEERTSRELYNLARERHISGRSKMKKEQLVSAIRESR